MFVPRRLIAAAVCATATTAAVVAPARAGLNEGLCHADRSRGEIPSNFAIDACFDGSKLTLRNSITIALTAVMTGDTARPSRRESDFGLAADATRLKSSDPDLLLPGDELRIPVGRGAATARVRGSSDDGFYALATTLATFFPGKPAAIVGAFTAFVAEVDADFTQYHQCLVRKIWFAQLGCRALLIRNLGFATGRGVATAAAKQILALLLSTTTFLKWVDTQVPDATAILRSGLIRIAPAAGPGPAPSPTSPPPAAAPPPPVASGAPTCSQWEQMNDTDADAALEAMAAAHNDRTPLSVLRLSVRLFCKVYPGREIDGVYSPRPTGSPGEWSGPLPLCSQWLEMSAREGDSALLAMMKLHGDTSDISTVRLSVGAYCHLFPDRTIDGVYGG